MDENATLTVTHVPFASTAASCAFGALMEIVELQPPFETSICELYLSVTQKLGKNIGEFPFRPALNNCLKRPGSVKYFQANDKEFVSQQNNLLHSFLLVEIAADYVPDDELLIEEDGEYKRSEDLRDPERTFTKAQAIAKSEDAYWSEVLDKLEGGQSVSCIALQKHQVRALSEKYKIEKCESEVYNISEKPAESLETPGIGEPIFIDEDKY